MGVRPGLALREYGMCCAVRRPLGTRAETGQRWVCSCREDTRRCLGRRISGAPGLNRTAPWGGQLEVQTPCATDSVWALRPSTHDQIGQSSFWSAIGRERPPPA